LNGNTLVKQRLAVGILAATVAAAILTLSGCGLLLIGSAGADEVREVLKSELVTYEPGQLPDAMVDRLAENELVLVGEYHELAEQDDFLADLITALHPRGFDRVLIESFSILGWFAERYALGEVDWLEPDNDAEAYYFGLVARDERDLLRTVRKLNESLPEGQKITVDFVDINHASNVFPIALNKYVNDGYLLSAPVLDEFLGAALAANNRGEYEEALRQLDERLSTGQDGHTSRWGQATYDRLQSLVQVELASLEIRKLGSPSDRDYSRKREEALIDNVERHLQEATGRTLMNFGGFHIQKRPRLGTVDKWAGDYLDGESLHVDGPVYSLMVTPARIVKADETVTFSLHDKSPANELARLMSERAGSRPSFLSFDDAFFEDERVVLNVNGNVISVEPKTLFDGFVVLPEGHYLVSPQ